MWCRRVLLTKTFFSVILTKSASHPPLVWLSLKSAASKLERSYKCRALLGALKANLCSDKWREENLNGNSMINPILKMSNSL